MAMSADQTASNIPFTEDAATEAEESVMTLSDHLEELRRRLILAVAAVLLGSVAGWFLTPGLVALLRRPIADQKLYFTGPADAFLVQLKLAFVIGLAIALPVILFQIWRFISPGLTSKERRLALPFSLLGALFFFVGLTVAYFIIPFTLNFLLNFSGLGLTPLLNVNSYLSFIAFFIFAFGLTFEVPIVLVCLAQVGIVTSQLLRKKRPLALIILWVVSCFITPGADPVSPVVLGISFTILYEISIIITRVTGK